jgi:hypothetical protein
MLRLAASASHPKTGDEKEVTSMDNVGTAWAVILQNPELRERLIREAARSRRSDQAASRPTLRRWLVLAVRSFAARPMPTTHVDPRPVPVTDVDSLLQLVDRAPQTNAVRS